MLKAYRGNGLRILCDVVREGPNADMRPLRSGCDAVAVFRTLQSIGRAPTEREAFVVLLLDGRHKTIGVHVASIGTVGSSPVHPREVFRAAIAAGATAIVVAHNHPSGDASPSADDRKVTERLLKAGELIGIEVLDHIVIGSDRFYSFASEACYACS